MNKLISIKIKLGLLFFLTTITSACQITYLAKSGYGQLKLLTSRQDNQEILNDPNVDEKIKAKIRLAEEAREFGINVLGQNKNKNYTQYVDLKRSHVIYAVSASPKWELKHHLWKFPMVGSVPYKGHFNIDDAKEEENELKELNLDTYLRGVAAYSTLGWFSDPLLSSMMSFDDHELVNLVLHENTHATLYIKSNADFNERLATFVGNKATELFYIKKEGTGSLALKKIEDDNHDERIFSEFISAEIKSLETWYKSHPEKDETKRMERLKLIQANFKESIQGKLKTENYKRFTEIELNNARLLLYKTYMQDLTDFELLFEKSSRDFKKFFETCKSLEKSDDPAGDLKKIISK